MVMQAQVVTVDTSTVTYYGDESEDAYDFEGAVRIHCSDCGYAGYVDFDSDGHHYTGQCECGESFKV